MGIFGHASKSAAVKAHSGLVSFSAAHFPDIMSDAQLRSFEDDVQKAGAELARLKSRLASDTNDLAALQADFDSKAAAGRVLLAQKNDAQGDALHAVEEGITELKNLMTPLKKRLEDAKARVSETTSDVTKREENLKAATEHLTSAKQKLSDATRENERLKDELQRQKDRRQENQSAVGISTSNSSAVIDAVNARNDKLRQAAEGMRLANESVEQASKTTHSSALEEALKASQPKKPSDSDALESLLS